jgi:hypothetical protein
MEIFRQLQMQRQETDAVPAEGDSTADPLVSSIAANYDSASDEGGGLEDKGAVLEMEGVEPDWQDQGAGQLTSSEDSPGSERALLHFSSDEPDVPLRVSDRSGWGQGKTKGRLPPLMIQVMPHAACADTDMLVAQVNEPDCPAVKEVVSAGRYCGQRKNKPSTSHRKTLSDTSTVDRSDSLKLAGKKKALDASPNVERSHSLRSAGGRKTRAEQLVASSVERSDSLRSAGKKSELPPKPTYAAIPSKDSKHSSKAPPLKQKAERVLYRMDTGLGSGGNSSSGLLAESANVADSSSGSDPDGLNVLGLSSPPRRSQGQGRRNLRKTKSRGKGKGAGTLTPTLLLDELSFTVHEPPTHLVTVHEPPTHLVTVHEPPTHLVTVHELPKHLVSVHEPPKHLVTVHEPPKHLVPLEDVVVEGASGCNQ